MGFRIGEPQVHLFYLNAPSIPYSVLNMAEWLALSTSNIDSNLYTVILWILMFTIFSKRYKIPKNYFQNTFLSCLLSINLKRIYITIFNQTKNIENHLPLNLNLFAQYFLRVHRHAMIVNNALSQDPITTNLFTNRWVVHTWVTCHLSSAIRSIMTRGVHYVLLYAMTEFLLHPRKPWVDKFANLPIELEILS